MKEQIAAAIEAVREKKPLTHVITHQITANDTANAILALGARPIMAEHPAEIKEIVAAVSALGVSLGNINDSRLQAIRIAGETACGSHKPHIIDCVGTAVSRLRFDFAHDYISGCRPAVVKGNASELLALVGCSSHAVGVDAGEEDALYRRLSEGRNDSAELKALSDFSRQNKTVVVITGEQDIVIAEKNVALVSNGTPLLGRITGTGCMLTGIITAFLGAGAAPLTAALAGLTVLGAAGEKAAAQAGINHPGTFHSLLFDALAEISPANLEAKVKMI
ncbi:MAG: hydroxyethylthiazole kinase [Selenomonadaceae bacterium]|nr:hydroxyethylthiazole kinase [Selenomonadaceae bacterium]